MELLPPSEATLARALFNEWLFRKLEPYLKGRVLEADTGFHTISSIFVRNRRPIHLSTPDKLLRRLLKDHYQGIEAVRKVHSINFRRPDFESAYSPENIKIFDTVLLVNPSSNRAVDDLSAKNAAFMLNPGGRLILLSPVRTAAYTDFDLSLEELKWHDRPSIIRLVTAEMDVLKTIYFHLPEILAKRDNDPAVLVVAEKHHAN